jgi:hypothetical protein
MKQTILTIILVLCAIVGTSTTAKAKTITKTYLFRGTMSGDTYDGYFYEEGKSGANYTCFPSPWTYGSTSSIHATLDDGITIEFASSVNQFFIYEGRALVGRGDVTVTVGGGNMHNYYIRHVTMYHDNGSTVIDETNWGTDVASTHTFSKTISAGFCKKLVITYSDEDIYLINGSTTSINGVDNEYEYAGSAVEPVSAVVCNGRTLTMGTHYDVLYSNNQTLGTATLTVTGKSPFHGSISKNYVIVDNAMVPMEWTAGSRIEVTEDYATTENISVTGNVMLVIADGVTLTIGQGITIADGATLTVNGPGTLTVKKERVNSSGIDNDGIVGNVIVNGGTVNVTGGNCSSSVAGARRVKYDPDHDDDLYNGVEGGAGIRGSLTVNGGIVTIAGGTGGYGSLMRGAGGVGISGSLTVTGGTVTSIGGEGLSSILELMYGTGGTKAKALGGTVTCTAARYVIQESNDNSTWNILASGSTSTKSYMRVFETTPLTLYDDADNTSAITAAAVDGEFYTVTLDGRTLYRDGYWNTLCLPFDVSLKGSPLDGDGVDVRSLTSSSFDSSTGALTLTFYDPEEVIGEVIDEGIGGDGSEFVLVPVYDEPTVRGPITTIEAGKPYIIRWGTPESHPSTNLTDPVFPGVTIKSGTTDTETDYVTFHGTFAPEPIYADPAVNLYIGGNNTLYWPSTEGYNLGAFRAYFELGNGLTIGEPSSAVRAFSFSFGDDGSEEMGIRDNKREPITNNHWYSLDGVRLDGKPTRKGLYIHGGRKVVVP